MFPVFWFEVRINFGSSLNANKTQFASHKRVGVKSNTSLISYYDFSVHLRAPGEYGGPSAHAGHPADHHDGVRDLQHRLQRHHNLNPCGLQHHHPEQGEEAC